MKVLALDCAADACSVALLLDGRLAGHRHQPMARDHAVALMPMVRTVLAQAAIEIADLDLLGVTVGPGSFTGLRVGLAAARGLSLAAGLPLIGVTTFEAVAHGARRIGSRRQQALPVMVALETKRRDLYIQCFDGSLTPLAPAAALMPEQAVAGAPASPFVVAGDAADRLVGALRAACIDGQSAAASPLPDALDVAMIAVERYRQRAPGTGVRAPAPFYLRPPLVAIAAGC